MPGLLKKVNAAAAKQNGYSGLTYRGERNGKTIVGYWIDGTFVVLSRHNTRGEALNKINALNGGPGNVFDAAGNLAATATAARRW